MSGMGAPGNVSKGLDTSGPRLASKGEVVSRRDTDTVGPRPETRSRMRVAALALVLGSMCVLSSVAVLQSQERTDKELLRAHPSYTAHAPIIIYRDADFNATNGVVSGTGAPDDPYIISGWDISTETIDACIFVFRTTVHFVIQNCHLHCPGAVCLELQEAPHGDIVNCTVDTGDIGIYVTKCPDTNITGNTVSNMENLSLMVSQSRWANVTGNHVSSCLRYGLTASWVSNGTVRDNFATGNGRWGIGLSNSTDIEVSGNNASENDLDGLWTDRTSRLDIHDNNITVNAGAGIRVMNSSDLRIFHNRIIGNAVQAYQETATNVSWDDGYPSGGNYWSDYAGADLFNGPDQNISGGDGIGDTPYTFADGGTDRYPFMTDGMELIPEFGLLALPILGMVGLFVVFLRPRKRL